MRLASKNIVLTGTTHGIGNASVKALYSRGHSVVMVNRDEARSRQVMEECIRDHPGGAAIYSVRIDFADLESISRGCTLIGRIFPRIDILINNAGLFSDRKKLTPQGLELTIGVNYLAQVLFTEKLIPYLKRSGSSRIINISSRAALFGKIRFRKIFTSQHPHGFRAYSTSKLAQVLWSRELSRTLEDIPVVLVHPGEVASNIWKGDSLIMKIAAPMARKRYKNAEEGAETMVHLALRDTVDDLNGLFIQDKETLIPYNARCSNTRRQAKLLDLTTAVLKEHGL